MKIDKQLPGYVAAIIAALFVIGCASSMPQTTISNPLELQGPAETVWQQCQMELKQRGFELDRVDQRSGIVNTYSQTSAHWFEFWRDDLADGPSRLESSLQTVRRKVQIQVVPVPADSSLFQVHCRVEVERLAPDPDSAQRAGVLGIRDVIGNSAGRAPGLAPREKKGREPFWESIGADPALEEQILSSLARRIQNTDGDRKL